jgi:hypothetical protein
LILCGERLGTNFFGMTFRVEGSGWYLSGTYNHKKKDYLNLGFLETMVYRLQTSIQTILDNLVLSWTIGVRVGKGGVCPGP